MSAGRAALPISVTLHTARRIRWDAKPDTIPDPPWLSPLCREVVLVDVATNKIVQIEYRREGVAPCPI